MSTLIVALGKKLVLDYPALNERGEVVARISALRRRAPLAAMSDAHHGARALRGAWMAVAGDPLVERIARALDARMIRVAEGDRVRYHAAAVIASNHVVALLGQVERVALSVGVPLEAFLELSATALENTRRAGPKAALTGPVSRGDWETVRAHIAALPDSERKAYVVSAQQACILAERLWPSDLTAT